MRLQQAGHPLRPAAYHNITLIDAMPAAALNVTTTERSESTGYSQGRVQTRLSYPV